MSRYVPSWCLPVVVAIVLSAQASGLDLAADAVDAGYLWGLGITGSGVEVAVVDVFAADGTHPAISGNFLGAFNFAVGPTFVSDHATAVAGAAASTNPTYTGVAPGTGLWSGQTTNRGTITKTRNQTVAAETFAQGLGGLNGNPAEIITMSISMGGATHGLDQWSLGLDHIVDTNGAVVTVAAGNDGPGGGTLGGLPSGAYNVITVGATGGTGQDVSEDYGQMAPYSSRGPTADGRSKPDIVAPGSQIVLPTLHGLWGEGSGTSFATPIVAGGAALLVDMGRQLGHTTDPRVVKSVLLNSATKLPGWSHTPSEPLDPAQGAGQMNLWSAHRQYLSAEQDAGAVSGIGWDLGAISGPDETFYCLDLPAPAGAVITATLTWNRTVTTDSEDIDKVVYSADPLADLDLKLYLADDPVNPVDVSVSAIDNLEHVYFTVSEPGQYVLGVSSEAAAAGYALAWSIGPGPGLDLAGDANLDGIVGIADLVALAEHYGLTDTVWFDGDFNADGLVGVADLVALADHYGAKAGTVAVPEPAALALLGAWAPAALRRKRSG
ncbi:MAG TPA: S8 family serine peptidase [Phycisphaerae bacterium]|nr:S8 family serine peptidase [Phycisphaerae bacterium]